MSACSTKVVTSASTAASALASAIWAPSGSRGQRLRSRSSGGATSSTPVRSPSHQVRQNSQTPPGETTPPAHRVPTPMKALTAVLAAAPRIARAATSHAAQVGVQASPREQIAGAARRDRVAGGHPGGRGRRGAGSEVGEERAYGDRRRDPVAEEQDGGERDPARRPDGGDDLVARSERKP